MNMLLFLCLVAGRITQWVHHPHFGAVNHMISQGQNITAATTGGLLFCTVNPDGLAFDSIWTYQGRLSWDRLSHLFRDTEDGLWVSYLGGGIDLFSPDGSVTRFGQLEGLPLNLMVNQVYADTAVYAATSQGLAIKTLSYFETFNASGTGGGLPSSVVSCVAPVDSGLLVGTYSGLTLLLPGLPPSQASSWRAVEPLMGKSLNTMAFHNDSLWVIASEELFVCPPGGQWTPVSSYPGSVPSSLLSSSAGLAVGDQNAVHTYSNGTWSSVENQFALGRVTALAEAGDGSIVAGMINTIAVDRLEGPGFAVIRGSGVTRHTPPGCISNDLQSIGVTGDGTCWVGAHRSGVGYLRGSEWKSVHGAMPNTNQIFALGAGGNTVFAASWSNGATWIGWDGFETTGGVTFTSGDGLLNNQINAISVWDDQTAWFAQEPFWQTPTEPSGVSRLSWQPGLPETASFINFSSDDNMLGKEVRDVKAVSATSVWAATNSGLAQLSVSSGVVRVFRTSDGLPSNNVRSIAVTRSGDVYAGTALGLVRVRNGAVQEIPGVTGSVSSLCADNRGGVWAAVPGTLYRITADGDVEAYTRYNSPLPEVDIRDMACDLERGRLWLATSHGAWMAELGQGLYHQGASPVVYPNPFRPGAGEALGIAGIPDEPMDVKVFDLGGVLLYQFSSSGRDDFAWDGNDSGGNPVPSGLYALVVHREGSPEVFKFALVR